MRRHILGIIALALLLGGGALSLAPLENAVWMYSLRIGAVLAALWLAYPQLERLPAWLPGWLVGGTIVAVVALARRPQLILVAIAVLVAAAILRPRVARPKPSRSSAWERTPTRPASRPTEPRP